MRWTDGWDGLNLMDGRMDEMEGFGKKGWIVWMDGMDMKDGVDGGNERDGWI